jgi:DNA-binding transcriptional ArsR family regulator
VKSTLNPRERPAARLPARADLPDVVDGPRVAAARAGLPAEDVLRFAAEVFKALASPVRLAIVHALAHDELSVGDLARALDLSLSVASQQLSVLRRLKLVAGRDEGRLTFYRVIDDQVGHLVHDCLAHVERGLGRAPSHGAAHRARPRGGKR